MADSDEKEPRISVFRCPPRCDAGGTKEDDGHIFDIPFETELSSGYRCKCGMDNISHAMWYGP